ncbi:unnamed protein product [Ceratitis capitata]|uniref:(Mediterranean fruit fly) hypothetical protein n=1 Tax=Ceratitis capitata TaxID=7213 RepID=A0A811UZW9_CERCA|nr:unnamed protein product [Ceratitis capitata]
MLNAFVRRSSVLSMRRLLLFGADVLTFRRSVIVPLLCHLNIKKKKKQKKTNERNRKRKKIQNNAVDKHNAGFHHAPDIDVFASSTTAQTSRRNPVEGGTHTAHNRRTLSSS